MFKVVPFKDFRFSEFEDLRNQSLNSLLLKKLLLWCILKIYADISRNLRSKTALNTFWDQFPIHSLNPPAPLFLKGGVSFNYLPWRVEGGIWKCFKSGWKYGVGVGLLKNGGGDWHFSYLILLRFSIFTFRNYFTKLSSAAGHCWHQQPT